MSIREIIKTKIYRSLNLLLFRKTNKYFKKSAELIISFSFDDPAQSSAINGGPILEGYGKRGTYYISGDLLGKECYGKKMASIADIKNVSENGHEIGDHTYYHDEIRHVSMRELNYSVKLNRQHIGSNYSIDTVRSFSFPKGTVRVLSKWIVTRYYSCCRTTRAGVNTGAFDLNMLKANKLYSRSIPVERQLELIDSAKKIGGWLIFYTHDVESHPSTFGCEEEYLKKVVSHAVKVADYVLPIGEVFEKIR